MCNIYFVETKIINHFNCGLISTNSFVINTKNFTESQSYNTCLNRKISIDIEGNIKNCPSMAKNFGNIKDTSLTEALHKKDFKAYWKINKDKIKVCQDCEFRHICTDCRAYVEDPKDKYSKPLKCGYNPYTNEWEDWSTNPLKQKTIAQYGLNEILYPNK
jgi:SPASM domain peptide maturase of grasp-with-spasm system